MADKRITELTNITGANLADADEFVVVDSSASETKAITRSELGLGINRLGYNGTQKIITTSTGVDVTGTVTADGLTVDGSIVLDNASAQNISFTNTAVNPKISSVRALTIDIDSDGNQGTTAINFTHDNGAGTIATFSETGDISFYEDTGTTPKFFWDASAEALGLGLTSPAYAIDVEKASADAIRLKVTNATTASLLLDVKGGATTLTSTGLQANNNGSLSILTGTTSAAERLRIDSSGNVGIGTSSPSTTLSLGGATSTSFGLSLTPSGWNNAKHRLTVPSDGGESVWSWNYDGSAIDSSLYPTGKITVGRYGLQFATGGTNTAPTERLRIDSSGRVILGGGSTVGDASADNLTVGQGAGDEGVTIYSSTTGYGSLFFKDSGSNFDGYVQYKHGDNYLRFGTAFTERMRIDSSGNLLVGKTVNNDTGAGFRVNQNFISSVGDGTISGYFHRLTSDGEIVQFRKDGTTVGSIGTQLNQLSIGSGDAGLQFNQDVNAIIPHNTATGSNTDNTLDLGYPVLRFKDLYLSGGVYLGGTGAANKLDDYEEGTWTPYLNGSVSLGTANYTKIGQLVYCEIKGYNVNVSSIGTTTGLYISGAPFTAATYQYIMPCAQQSGVSFGIYDASGSNLYLGIGNSAVDYVSVNRDTFGGYANLSFRFSFTYRTSA